MVTEHDPTFILQIGKTGGTTHMGVASELPAGSKTFTIGQDGEELTIVPESDFRSMPVYNLPPEVLLKYAATTADGRILLVLQPRDDATYDDAFVFFGPPTRVLQRHLESNSHSGSGSAFLTFDVDGVIADASFPGTIDRATGSLFTPGTPSLTIGSDTSDMTLLAPNVHPDGVQYFCTQP